MVHWRCIGEDREVHHFDGLCGFGYERRSRIPLILGKPFLETGKALIVVQERKLTLRINEEQVMFIICQPKKSLEKVNTCHMF